MVFSVVVIVAFMDNNGIEIEIWTVGVHIAIRVSPSKFFLQKELENCVCVCTCSYTHPYISTYKYIPTYVQIHVYLRCH